MNFDCFSSHNNDEAEISEAINTLARRVHEANKKWWICLECKGKGSIQLLDIPADYTCINCEDSLLGTTISCSTTATVIENCGCMTI